MASINGFTPIYDNNGNVLNDNLHTYSWDAYGRPITIDSVNLTYDALGRMVERNNGGSISQVLYAPSGAKLSVMNGQSLTWAFVPLTSGAAEYHANGVFYYRHADWLGSARLVSTTSRTMYSDTAYAPFGEPYAQGGGADWSWTGINQDTQLGLYDFPAREYSIQGRWPSPDPAGLAAVDPSNPQSWNRYAYVLNNPTNLVDPLGLTDCPQGKTCGITLDGTEIDVSGWFGRMLLGFLSSSDAAAQCPNNDCTNRQLVAGPGGTNVWQQLGGGVTFIPNPNWNPNDLNSMPGSFSVSSIAADSDIFWDLFTVPWSGTALYPLVSFGPVASAGVGPTLAYNPRTDTGCYGIAAGAMVPAGGHAAAVGPLSFGNLGNADNILAGGSVFAGAQSPNPFVGVQAMGNRNGLLAGATFGIPGVVAGASVSKCQGGVGKKLLNWFIDSIL
ncbi:MAG TPA: RHS repeat-associated core domain-containing protein [Candidatus Acidoferrum sp.]|nr:RHS repeat-associated core domain-containing protein [Candidatus Acidoferrum sp.]